MGQSTPGVVLEQAASKSNRKPTQQLNRTTFETSRLLDFCSEKELTAQIGHDTDDWALVVLKELIDNALDACEEANTAPEITVKVDQDGITVTDNGPGIPGETIAGVMDYSVRVSNREAYVAPDRGAQGNALKTLLAMPFVLDGTCGRVDVASHGERREITFKVDPIRQEPVVSVENVKTGTSRRSNSACSKRKGAGRSLQTNVRTGTSVKLWWPDSASSELEDAKDRFLQLADDYTVVNPHLTLSIDWFGAKSRTEASATDWSKWRPNEPTSAHWYELEHIERLFAAYITHDQDRGTDRSVREVVREFRGLTGTAKQKKVLEATGLARTNLSALANGDGLQHDVTAKLLAAMIEHSNPVKPAQLGVIGKDHVAKRFADLGVEMESFSYKKVAEVDDDGLPMVLETAFGWRGEKSKDERRLITGVNWSPGIVNPFRTLGSAYGDGLAAMLEKQYAGSYEPIVFLLHCACPRVQYTDRGKSAVVMK